MATIPTFVSKERISTEAPAVMQRQKDFGPMADPNMVKQGAGKQVAQDVFELGQKIKQVEDANDYSKAEINTTSGMLALEEQIKKDPTSFKDYDNTMQKIGDEAAKGFRNADAKEKFKQDFGLKNVIFKNKMQGVVLKHEVDVGRTNTLTAMDMESSNYINAADDSEKLASRQKIENTMAQSVKLGLFSAEDGYQAVEKTIKDADTAIKDRSALKAREAKELAWAQKEAINARENEFMTMKVKGVDKLGTPISRAELIDMARKEAGTSINPKFADLYINALKSPKAVKAKTIDKDFSNIIYEINQGKMKPEAIKTAMLDLVSNGNISEEDFTNATSYLDMLGEYNPDDIATNGKRNAIQSFFSFANDNTKEAESRAMMSRNFIKKINSGVDADTAAIEVMKEEVLRLRPEAREYPEGMLFIDNDGRKKRIMPNGDLLPEEEKKATTKK